MKMSERSLMSKQLCTLLAGVERHGALCSPEVVGCSLYLLQNVPATRQAVLEYLSLVFDEAASVSLRQDIRAKGVQQYDYEGLISQVRDILQLYIKRNPVVWTPTLSKWSIELLGQISTKLRHGNHQSPSLNEQLQQWMTCYPTNTLIQIASDCLAAMVGSTPEVCVDALLEASVKYAPHFDWVVAHIGSCFPKTVIQRVLLVGLGEYHNHMTSHSHPGDPNKIPKLSSVVGILAHLAGHHTKDLHHSLIALFQASLEEDRPSCYKCVVAYLLRLAYMSPVLLQALASNVTKVLTPSVINQLCGDLSRSPTQDMAQLGNVVTQLLRRCTHNAYEITQLLLQTATQPHTDKDAMEVDEVVSPLAQSACSFILNGVLMELQRCVHRQGTDGGMTVPFLHSLKPHGVLLTKQLAVASGNRYLWLSRLVACIGLHSTQHEMAVILTSLLVSAVSHQQLDMLMDLHSELCIRYPEVLRVVLAEVMAQLKDKMTSVTDKGRIIHNLQRLVHWEKQHDARFSGYSVVGGIQEHLSELSRQLVGSCSVETLGLMSVVELPHNISLDTASTLRQNVQVAFLAALTRKDKNTKFEVCVGCIECFQRLCVHSSLQSAILRHLLDVALSKEYREYFGGSPPEVVVTPASSTSLSRSLERTGHERLKDSCLTPTRPTGLHDGVIGRGVKPTPRQHTLTQNEIDDNKELLVDALWMCCCSTIKKLHPTSSLGTGSRPNSPNPTGRSSRASSPSPHGLAAGSNSRASSPFVGGQPSPAEKSGRSGGISPDVGRDLALIIVELVTPDVMYNGILWPEEDFMKVTTERDLLIKKKIDKNPILWPILELLVKAPGALCYCSVILRSLMATMISYWETSRHLSASTCVPQLTISLHLITLLRQGGMLAAPLSYIGELFSYLTPYEVYLLLLSVWRYMKENPPDPRIPRREGCDPRYTETLRHIFESNIASIGHLYPRIFVHRIT